MKYFECLFFLLIFSCTGTEETVPLPPTNLITVPVSESQVNLSWIDNSTNESGFKIERKTGTNTYTEIGKTGVNETVYNDNTGLQNTEYSYRVYAYNSAGNSITYSNESIASTFGIPSLSTSPVTYITSKSAVSGGSIFSTGGHPIIKKGLVWSTTTGPTISLTTKTENEDATTNFTSNLTDLTLGTKYYLRAFASNSIGTGYGDELEFTTLATSIEIEQLDKLSGVWTVSQVRFGSGNTDRTSEYIGMSLTFTGTFVNDGTYNYSVANRPSLSPWPASGTWKFDKNNPENLIIRTEDNMPMTYSVTTSQLQIIFTYAGSGYNARTQAVEGTWTFLFSK